MTKELVISSNRHETKVALIEDDQLVEVYFQRANEYSLVGSIHKGRVTRVLPGMQSAFVDIGLERDTFLYVSDFLDEHEDFDKVTGEERPARQERGRDRDRRPPRSEGSRNEPRGEGSRYESRTDNRGDARTEPRAEGQPENNVTDGLTDGAAGTEAIDEAAPVSAAQTEVAREETIASSGEAPEGSESAEAVTGAPVQNSDREDSHDRERRGRRSRRRRRGSRGLPDSKYATESKGEGRPEARREAAPEGAEASPSQETLQAEPEHPTHAPHQTADHPGHVAPIILPGESLAKYRGVAAAPLPVEPEIEDAEEEDDDLTEVESLQEEYNEPIHYPPENALPDAPAHPSALEQPPGHISPEHLSSEPAAPVHPISVQTSAHLSSSHGVIADSEPQPLRAYAMPPPLPPEAALIPPSPVSADAIAMHAENFQEDQIEDPEGEEDEAEDSEPAVMRMLDDDEDRDIQAMILGDVEGIEISEPEEELQRETQGGEGVQQAAPQESGRPSGQDRGRFPQRGSRRRRRGGRGDQDRGEARGDGRGENRGEARTDSREPRTEGRPEGRSDRPEHRSESRSDRGSDRSGDRGERISRPSGSRPNNDQPLISDLLKEGQEIIVQIAKEPLGQKGARITSHIALPGRYVVYMPTLEHMGVSRKIASDEERLRLKHVLRDKRPGPVGGFITRTAAEGRTEEEIGADMLFLYNLWQDIKKKADSKSAPLLLHHDLDIVQRILRDQLADSFKAIWIDNEDLYESVLSFVQRFQPALVGKVKLYTREAPIFDAFNITAELEKALRPKVWLKSGGFIVINQTEALVAIDVNTGKYVGKTNRLEDTIVKTNTEAIKEIVRQIRLRDLGGIIVIDFIDMDERKNRQKVMQVLEEAMRVDRAPYKILQFNDFGLVAITRKRVKQSLERTLCAPCPHCEGAGYVKSVNTVVSEILTEARKMAKSVEGKDILLRVHPEVGKVLKSNQNKFLEELEEVLRRPVLIKSDPQLHQEKFDLA